MWGTFYCQVRENESVVVLGHLLEKRGSYMNTRGEKVYAHDAKKGNHLYVGFKNYTYMGWLLVEIGGSCHNLDMYI